MDRYELARNIATSLSAGAWNKQALETALTSRLPRPLHRLVSPLTSALLAEAPGIYAPNPHIVAITLGATEEFQQILRYCLRHNIWPNPDLTPPKMSPVAAFAGLELPQLPTVQALADWLDVPVRRLEYLADVTGRFEDHAQTAVNNYHRRLLKKKTGGVRLIEAPKTSLKTIQRKVLTDLLNNIPSHKDTFGFVQGRNCLEAAQRHAGEEIVVCFDLRNFFPSLRYGRVFGLFRCLGYPQNVATRLSALSTVRTPNMFLQQLSSADRAWYNTSHLPQGAPTSPALANQLAFGLDRRLAGLARSLQANYSRYADDLTFSGDSNITATLLRAVPDIAASEGLFLNPAKTRIMSQTSRQSVTGVVVNSHLNITRDKYDQLKAIIHACSKPGDRRIFDPDFRAKLSGRIAWAEAVNPRRGHRLREKFEATMGARELT